MLHSLNVRSCCGIALIASICPSTSCVSMHPPQLLFSEKRVRSSRHRRNHRSKIRTSSGRSVFTVIVSRAKRITSCNDPSSPTAPTAKVERTETARIPEPPRTDGDGAVGCSAWLGRLPAYLQNPVNQQSNPSGDNNPKQPPSVEESCVMPATTKFWLMRR